jgi:hypothetical protein
VELNDALLALEHQAAVVAACLDGADAELLQQVADGWAPGTTPRQAGLWLQWLRDCQQRWQQQPPDEPSADEMHRVLIKWATGTPRLRRHKTGHG